MSINWFEVKAIILDLGGVILDIDYQLTIDAFQKLGFKDFDLQYSQMQQSGLFDLLETGKIAETNFVQEIQLQIPTSSEQEIISAWNALLLDFPAARIDTVRAIADRFPTFLLSNTNAIHYKAFNKTLYDQTGLRDIKTLFKKAYLSHEIHLRKPDSAAFEIILADQNLRAREVLFVDDSPQHIEGARKLGIQAYHLKHPERLESIFGALLA